jgi:sulfur carrier protein
MNIMLNAQPISTSDNLTLEAFLQQQNNLPDQFAIAVNKSFVAQSLYATTLLSNGDDIELLVPMQGG